MNKEFKAVWTISDLIERLKFISNNYNRMMKEKINLESEILKTKYTIEEILFQIKKLRELNNLNNKVIKEITLPINKLEEK